MTQPPLPIHDSPSDEEPLTQRLNPLLHPELDLPWETLEALVEGKSPIDLNLMPVKTRKEAFDLIYNYGYDTRDADDRAEALQLLAEAIAFVETRFLQLEGGWDNDKEPHLPVSEVPVHIKQMQDLEDLVLMASSGKKPDKLWACAILKVLHTLVHLHNNPTLKYSRQASDSIVSNFHRLLLPMHDGTFSLVDRDGLRLNLYGFETKYNKARESILIKLLCKKENVAEDVWDVVGVRLITHQPADALLAIEMLRKHKIMLFSNIIPSRSKNNLFDFDHLRTQYEKAVADMAKGKRPRQDALSLLRSIALKVPQQQDFLKDNPSTHPGYRSIHVTCRHFLRLQSEASKLSSFDDQDLLALLPFEGERPLIKADERLAFPYEIQILDKESFLENQSGKSAHSLYKQKQLASARRRVLNALFQYYQD